MESGSTSGDVEEWPGRPQRDDSRLDRAVQSVNGDVGRHGNCDVLHVHPLFIGSATTRLKGEGVVGGGRPEPTRERVLFSFTAELQLLGSWPPVRRPMICLLKSCLRAPRRISLRSVGRDSRPSPPVSPVRLLRHLPLIASFAAALLLAGCQSRAIDPSELIPADSVAFMRISWRTVQRDPMLSKFVKAADFENTFRELGVVSNDVDTVIVFAGVVGSDPATGLIVKTLKTSAGGFAHTFSRSDVHRGVPTARIPSGALLAALDDHLFAIGTTSGVLRVIDMKQDPQRRRVTTRGRQLLEPNARAPILLFAALPRGLDGVADLGVNAIAATLQSLGHGAVGSLLRAIGLARAISISISPSDSTVRLEVRAAMKDASAAGISERGLRLLDNLAVAVAPQDALPPRYIERRGTVLIVRLDVRSVEFGQ